jgi:hypothetical protein
LLLDERGRVKVADFGIASAAGLDSFTQTGTVLGTAGYLSPEQARGEQSGPASDRYGLAVVAWELFTGRRPFEAQTPAAEAAAHVQAPVPQISDANRDLPRAFDPIFTRALAKDPAKRFPSAAEFVGELHRALEDDAGSTWVVPGTTAPVLAPRRRVPVALVVAAIVVALAGIAAAVIATHDGGGSKVLVRTVTRPGTTVEHTITTSPTTSPQTTTQQPPADGAALNNEGYAKMRAGDYSGALPLLQQAVSALQGTGSLDEAYADYNLAYTRSALGSCSGVVDLLDRSQQIQGHRKEIDRLRHDARKNCQDEG